MCRIKCDYSILIKHLKNIFQLHDNEEKKDAENDNVVYADIDKSALDSGKLQLLQLL